MAVVAGIRQIKLIGALVVLPGPVADAQRFEVLVVEYLRRRVMKPHHLQRKVRHDITVVRNSPTDVLTRPVKVVERLVPHTRLAVRVPGGRRKEKRTERKKITPIGVRIPTSTPNKHSKTLFIDIFW